jgi:HD-GYP domain-containing protein (c-di-GMP phosphodiesterase class II)
VADKIKLQEKLVETPERLDLARAYEEKLQTLGRTLMAGLYMLVRNVKLYEPENEIFIKPLEQLKDTINTIVAMDEALNLQGAGESFYLNNMLIKIDINSLENIKYLLHEFETHNVGGFILSTAIAIPELRDFIFIFSSDNREQAGERGVSSRKLSALKLRRWEKIQEILKEQYRSDDQQDKNVDRKRYTLTIYARAIYFMRAYLAGLRGQGPQIPLRRASRFVQDLVDISFGHRTHFLGLTTLKSDDDYLCFHSVNVTLLSIVFGGELGMSKQQLRDLGMAAMFHDIGMVDISEELLMKRGKLAPGEIRQVRRSPIYSVKRIIRTRELNKLTIHRIITAYEHKSEFGKPVKDLKGNVSFVVPRNDLGVYSKIVSIADCYDALTSRRPHRDPYSSDIALTLMWTELKHKFDPEYLKVFMNVMRITSVKVFSDKGEKIVIF